MKQKSKSLIRKTIVIVFMALIVLGFTVPGFLHSNDENNNYAVEPRLCKTDAECYLTCDDLPVKVLCAENICQQNSCEEYAIFEFTEPPFSCSDLSGLSHPKGSENSRT